MLLASLFYNSRTFNSLRNHQAELEKLADNDLICSSFIDADDLYNNITEFVVNDTLCITGSFIIGADTKFISMTGFLKKKSGKGYLTQPQTNILGVLQSYDDDGTITIANTAIACYRIPCRIQIFGVDPSYKMVKKGISYDGKSFVSTKRSGSASFPYKYKYKLDDNNRAEDGSFLHYRIWIVGYNNKSFTYRKDEEIRLVYKSDGEHHREYNNAGSLGIASHFFLQFDPNFGKSHSDSTLEGSGDVYLKWEDTRAREEKEMLIPEFEAILSSKEGVYTIDNINQSGGLHPVIIAFISIISIIVVAFIADLIWIFACGGFEKGKASNV